MALERFYYDNKIVKYFVIATVVWGLVGMLVGLTVATELWLPQLNAGIEFITFGRLRPLHTNAIIFAFIGNAIFAGVYHSSQRVLKARLFSDLLSWIHFWGWQLIIVAAALTLTSGFTTSKEYAELEWPIDIAIAVVWVVFGLNFIMTMVRRREKHIYVALWFYISTWATVAILHIVNSFEVPVHFMKSYSFYAGVQDALVQWWYGHNAVAFFLTTPFLGLMYYYLPKAANRPVYSYKLSIFHFWALIFIYIWAGPHHLIYTSLPQWVQMLGTAFSIMLIAPSWGGMLNGLLTLRGAWDKVRDEPILKFMVVALTAYGMATLEGPLMATKAVNRISHYTDWVVAHVHVGGLGWNGFITFGMLYYLVPKLWNTEIYSKKLANTHFWIGTMGIIFYVVPIYIAALTQSLMWKEFTEFGTLKYPNFLQTLIQILPMHMMRSFGGLLYLTGAIIMTYNLFKTAQKGSFVAEEAAEAPALDLVNAEKPHFWHQAWERKPVFFTVLSVVAIAVGTMIEIIPTMLVKSNVPTISSVKPYTPLELEGRDIYIREGCNACHSQMVRPFRDETVRYEGEYSKPGEFVYDHPFLWGSKRTGPDLHRVGGKYPDSWHFNHMLDPRITSEGSIMPPYPWLHQRELNTKHTAKKIAVMRTLGVPYEPNFEEKIPELIAKQQKQIVESLKKDDIEIKPEREIIALIAYLQRLGTDIKAKDKTDKVANAN